MAYLDPKSKHSLSRLDKIARNQSGKILSISGVRRGILRQMQVKAADTVKMAQSVARTTHQLALNNQSKQQILRTFRRKWDLKDNSAQKLLGIIAPEKTGRTAAEEKKWKAGNIRYRRLQGIGSMGRLSGSPEDKGKKTREDLKKPRVPESSFAKKQTGGQASVSSISGHSIGGIANAHEGAAGIAKVSPLEVKDGSMKVKLNKGGQGLAVQPGKGVTGVANLKDASNDETESNPENHKDMSHQVPLAGSGLK